MRSAETSTTTSGRRGGGGGGGGVDINISGAIDVLERALQPRSGRKGLQMGGGEEPRVSVNLASVGAIADPPLADEVRRYVRRVAIALADPAGVWNPVARDNPLAEFAPQTPDVWCAHSVQASLSKATVTMRWTGGAGRRGDMPVRPASQGEFYGMAKFLHALHEHRTEQEEAADLELSRPKALRVWREWRDQYSMLDYDPATERVEGFRIGERLRGAVRKGESRSVAMQRPPTYSLTLVLVRDLPEGRRRPRIRVRGGAKRSRGVRDGPPPVPSPESGGGNDQSGEESAPEGSNHEPAHKRQRCVDRSGAAAAASRIGRRRPRPVLWKPVRASRPDFWPLPDEGDADHEGGAEERENAMAVDSERALHGFPLGTRHRRRADMKQRLRDAVARRQATKAVEAVRVLPPAGPSQEDMETYLNRLYTPLG